MSEIIALCPNLIRDKDLKITLQVKELLENNGFNTVISPLFIHEESYEILKKISITPLEHAIKNAKLAVALGGDGTVLKLAKFAAKCDVPIIGINLGHMGFMAEISKDEIDKISLAAKGEFRSSVRMMLDVNLVRNGEVIHSDIALNDAVISGIVHMVYLEILRDGKVISSFSGDGIIAATPTGSTAYSLSAGGPLTEPEAENILLTPICAHVRTVHSFVLAPTGSVMIKIDNLNEKNAILSIDGGEAVSLQSGDILEVKKSNFKTILAQVGYKSFFDIVYEKLGV